MRYLARYDSLLILLLLFTRTESIYHTTFCMPTASRVGVSYLNQVVSSYEAQGIFRMDGVSLMVLDADNSTSGRYLAVRNRKTSCTHSNGEATATSVNVHNDNKPSCKVQQQGLDVVAALMQCAEVTTGWVVLVEDDCVACDGALDEVVTTLASFNNHNDNNNYNNVKIGMAKFSKFMRATAFPVDTLPRYTASVMERLDKMPYDITIIEQWPMSERSAIVQYYVHTRNLFHHIGLVSTEASRNEDDYMKRYAALRGDVCFEELV